MVRVGGMSYTCAPGAKSGERISEMRLKGQLIDPNKTYKVAGWAPVQEASKNAGPPIWDVVESYLKSQKVLKPIAANNPKLLGMDGNPGIV